MFDHKHYVPVLKGKRAEFPSLGKVKNPKRLTPLIEAIPTADHDSVPKQIDACGWNGKPYFLDLLFLADSKPMNKPLPALVTALKAANKLSQFAIPVTGTGRSPDYQLAIQSLFDPAKGFAIRLVPADFDGTTDISKSIAALVSFMGAKRSNTDLMIDLGSTSGHGTATIRQIHEANLSLMPHLQDWRTLTVISGAFPLGLAELQQGAWNVVSRSDWLAWESLIMNASLKRKPSFGDYAIAHPGLPPVGRATILAQLRYSTPKTFLIWKGKNAVTQGYDQFYAICKDMAGRAEYCGSHFSDGDAEIQAKAAKIGTPGNAETWRKIGTNHHFEKVLSQIASLP